MKTDSQIVADSLVGLDFRTIYIGGETFTIYPPTIKNLCRAIHHLSQIGMEGEYNALTALAELPHNAPHLIRGLSVLIIPSTPWYLPWKHRRAKRALLNATCAELREAIENIIPLIGGEDFFACAAMAKSIAKIAAKQERK